MKDPNVEDFLDRVRELDERRKLEDEIRRKKLRLEVMKKKAKMGLMKGNSHLNRRLSTDDDLLDIKIPHPVARPSNNESSIDIMILNPVARVSSPNTTNSFDHPDSDPDDTTTPALLKYRDTMDVEKTIQRLIGRRHEAPEKHVAKSPDTSDSEEELPPPLPNRRTETPPRLPARKPVQLPEPSKPNQPQQKSHQPYIPRPNAVAVLSATAAAKAPQLMKNSVDSTVGERSPGLSERARYLSSSPVHSKSSQLDLSSTNKPLTNSKPVIPSPQKSSWLNSALSHSGTTKQTIASQEPKIKLKPMVPSKPNSLVVNNEKSRDLIDNSNEISEPKLTKTTLPQKELNSKDVPEALNRASKLKPLPPPRKPSYTEPEALTKIGKLKASTPVTKRAAETPEALLRMSMLRSSLPIIKPASEIPEALKKSGLLKPALPSKKPSLATVEAIEKLSSLKRTETSPIRGGSVTKNYELEHIDFLQQSMGRLKKNMNQEAARPVSRRTNTDMSPVRLPFADPNAQFPLARPKTFDSAELGSKPEKLVHVTKTRARGPKRRLPKTIKEDTGSVRIDKSGVNDTDTLDKIKTKFENTDTVDEPQKIADYKVRVANSKGKVPPPVTKTSRLVSNKLEQRVFSNSDLFL